MRSTRKFLRLISGDNGIRHPKYLRQCFNDYRPTFWEFFALIILMNFYFYPDDLISPVIREFYQLYKPRFATRWPKETEKQRLILIQSNAYACSTALENESELESMTKKFDKLYQF